jgi:hypothetical protein
MYVSYVFLLVGRRSRQCKQAGINLGSNNYRCEVSFFWNLPGALARHVRTQLGTYADRTLKHRWSCSSSLETCLPCLTHTYTYTHLHLQPPVPSCDASAELGARTLAGGLSIVRSYHRADSSFANVKTLNYISWRLDRREWSPTRRYSLIKNSHNQFISNLNMISS